MKLDELLQKMTDVHVPLELVANVVPIARSQQELLAGMREIYECGSIKEAEKIAARLIARAEEL